MEGLDPLVIGIAALTLVVVLINFFLKSFKIPSVVGYIIAGILLGSWNISFLQNTELITALGSIGVLLLLFFIGMEIDIRRIISDWKIAFLGVFLKIIISIGLVYLLSWLFIDWSFGVIVLLGFAISLSSTAVVLKILVERNEMETRVGSNVVSVLLVQDIVIVPMLIIIGLFGGDGIEIKHLMLQMVGAFLFISLFIYIIRKGTIKLPFGEKIKSDTEIQVFTALFFCFSFSIISAVFGLSASLGAFVAGMLVSAGKETKWFKESLHPFYIFFMAMFFLSVGLLIDLEFIKENFLSIIFLVGIIFILNTLIYTFVFQILGSKWRTSVYAGALLSQVGEFSFVLAAVGLGIGLIKDFTYQMIITIISISLLLSPLWISLIKQAVNFDKVKLKRLSIRKIRAKFENKE